MYTCPIHGGTSVEREGKFGTFYGCPTYAETKCKEKQVLKEGDTEYNDPEIPGEYTQASPAQKLAQEARAKAADDNQKQVLDALSKNSSRTQSRIERQHSQEMAIRYLDIFTKYSSPVAEEIKQETIKDLTDWFQKDLENSSL